ncbi:pigment biosynthesis Ayg1 protein [Rutstroemia sp. NJR-2017a BBW]|nr:pigment biosynthesis Ayg1 protein [Rutstroemia sp. NJR-2017a BBW]
MSPTTTELGNGRTWTLGDKFEAKLPHHEGSKALWETKWKFPCTKSLYPFHDGKYEDFEPVFEHLIKNDINDGYGDAYTEAFFPIAEKLTKQGDEAMESNNRELASELYLRAACLYRIARFPYIGNFPKISSQSKWKAWEAQKKVYMKAGSKWDCPFLDVSIPYTAKEGKDRDEIPLYIRYPANSEDKKVPVVLLLTGLDGYRPDNTTRSDEFINRGWGCVIAEIPGTADSPADPSDPDSPDRLWTSVLDWMEKEGRFDMKHVMVWGLSTGGYYAVRLAHTHKDRLRGVVAQGAGVHYFFGKDWLEKAEGHEYPFQLGPAMALKHGYDSVDEFRNNAQKRFSLLETGIIQKPSTRLLLINYQGTHDGLMPIEDSQLLFEHGTPKEARFFANALHMGYPMANSAHHHFIKNFVTSDMTRHVINPQAFERVSKCIASTIRSHPANTSGDGLCPQLIISSYSYRHWIWSAGANDAPAPEQLGEKEGFVRDVIDQMIEEKMLIEVSRFERLPATIGLPATEEQCYVLDPRCEHLYCAPGRLCDDVLRPEAFNYGQADSNSSSSEDGDEGSSAAMNTDATSNALVSASSDMTAEPPRKKRTRGPNKPKIDFEAASILSNSAKVAQELEKLPWLSEGLVELCKKYPDDIYEVVYINDALLIRCHDCTHRLYKVHFSNRDVSNIEYHAKATLHSQRVEDRLREAGRQAIITPEVQQRRLALENAKKVVRRKGGPAAFPGAHQPASASLYFPPQKKPTKVVPPPSTISVRGYQPEDSVHSVASEAAPGDEVNYGTFSATRPMHEAPTAGPSHDDTVTPVTRIRNLESRIMGLEQECVDQARTIDTLHIKLRNQQQVENTHQAVIRDMVQRVQSLEEKYRFKDDDITELKSNNADLQAKVQLLEQAIQQKGSEFETLSAQQHGQLYAKFKHKQSKFESSCINDDATTSGESRSTEKTEGPTP